MFCFLFCSFAAILYTSCILVGIFINSSVPIFFELFIETVYPVPEGITCGVVTFLGNLVTGLLLFFLTFYCTGRAVRPWGLTAHCLAVHIMDIVYFFYVLSMKKPQICEISAPFRSFQHPCSFVLLPKSHSRHCFQKSISSLAEAANKRQTVGKLGYNAADTFSTKKEEIAIVI